MLKYKLGRIIIGLVVCKKLGDKEVFRASIINQCEIEASK
jgi:hypothetical protein